MNVAKDERALRFSANARPWLFLGLTLGLTWLFGFLAAAVGESAPRWGVTTLHFVGGLMPLAVAAGLTHLKHDRPFQRDYWRRIIDFRRISGCWYAVIILYTPVKSGLAALIDILLGGEGIAPEVLARFAEQPLLIVPTIIFWLLFGPVPEEPGWRGYALDGLQARRNALSASLIVGVVWSLWHLPLFFIEGTWQAEQVGLGTQRRIRYDRLATMQRLCQNSISSSAFRSAAHGWNQVVTVGQTVQAVPGSRADLDQTATVRDEGPHLRRRARGACTCATGDL